MQKCCPNHALKTKYYSSEYSSNYRSKYSPENSPDYILSIASL